MTDLSIHISDILGMRFKSIGIATDTKRAFDGFDGAYEPSTGFFTDQRTIELIWQHGVTEPSARFLALASPVVVHRAPYRRWRLDGLGLQESGSYSLFLPDEGMTLRISDGCKGITACLQEQADYYRAGEIVHLLLRNLVAHMWNPSWGLLLHSSASVRPGRGAILHVGASGVGKTEALLKAVYRYGDIPLSNDRTCINTSDFSVFSWPSYLTATRQTCQRYYRLFFPESTLIESSENKVLVPMSKLVAATGKSYARLSGLSDIYVYEQQWSEMRQKPRLVEKESDIIRAEKVLAASSFVGKEKDFLPWHGMKPICESVDWVHFIKQAAASGSRVWLVE